MPQQPPPQDVLSEIVRRLNDNTRRIRVVEEKFHNLESRIIGMEKLVIENQKEANTNAAQMVKDLGEIRDKTVNMEVDIQNLKRESKKMASKTEIKEFENYISLINPILTKFVTRKEVEEILEQKMNNLR